MKEFFIPTKPYSIIDAVNRMALATGSVQGAISGQSADFNGHRLRLEWNNYRSYYVGEYTWNGRNVFHRGTDFEAALCVSLNEFDRGGRGTSLYVSPHGDEDMVRAANCPKLMAWSEEIEKAEDAKWKTWAYAEVNSALRMERQFSIPYVAHLIQAKTKEEYDALVQGEFDKRKKERIG